jgi:hypothetical protein
VNPPETAELVPPDVDTVTLTFPADAAGVENISDVAEFTVTEAVEMVDEPIVTEVLPATKLVPVIVTLVPPAVGPYAGDSDVAVGANS